MCILAAVDNGYQAQDDANSPHEPCWKWDRETHPSVNLSDRQPMLMEIAYKAILRAGSISVVDRKQLPSEE